MKTLSVVAAVLVCAGSSQAQGTVDFKNSTSSLISNAITMNRVVGGTTFTVALYYLPDNGMTPSTRDFDERGTILLPHAHFQGSSTVASGIFQGGVRTTPSTTPPDGLAWFQVRAWETVFGATYEEAVQNPVALTGTSVIFRMRAVDPNRVPIPTPGQSGLQEGFFVGVPEPSSLALGTLGFLALFSLPRRKRRE